MWVVFEGPDDVGKTTLVRAVHERLCQLGAPVTCTAEPGALTQSVCKALRALLFSGDVVDAAEILLFLADRIQHEELVVLPALVRGQVVLQDRGQLSTYIYQVLLRKNGARRKHSDEQHQFEIMTAAWKGRKLPDIVVLCNADEQHLSARREVDSDHFVRERGRATTDMYNIMHTGEIVFPYHMVGNRKLSVVLNTLDDIELAAAAVLRDII